MHEHDTAFLELIFESLPAFVFATDAGLRLTLLEGSVLPGLGLGKAEIARLLGTRAESFLGEEQASIIERLLPLQRGETVTFEMIFRGRWYSVQAEPLRDSSHRVIGSIGVGIDTTERHALAEELIKERDSLSETQQLAELGSWTRDLPTDTVSLSRELSRILDIPYTREPIPYTLIAKRIHPEDRDRFLYETAEALRLRATFRLDHRIIQRTGTMRYVRTQGAYEFDDLGNALRCLGTMIDTTDRVEAQQAAEHLAYHDALTDLPNRLLLADRIAQSIALGKREHQRFYVIFVDLDNFKDINDSLGHAQGDALLIEVANRLRHATRTTDTVARSGGDEFIVLLANLADDAHLDAAVLKLRHVFSAPFRLSDGDHPVTASIGYAAYPDDGSSAAELLQHADTAMYDAKRAGRNSVRRYTPASTEDHVRRMQLEVDLIPALATAQFRTFYQPIVDAKTLHLLRVEALLRWEHPTRGLLSPEHFIGLAEHGDFILALGRWAMNDACAQLSRFRRELRLRAPLRLSLNVSPRQIINRDHFIEGLQAALRDNRIEATAIELELTENTLMREFEAAVGIVAAIRELGIGIAIDDFGTGYNSFSYLKHLPVTTLKIDRSFVSGSHSAFDNAISNAIATLGTSLGLRVVAEGVETPEQCSLLQAIGCSELQGYYFARPMPPAELVERYGNGRGLEPLIT